MNNNSAPSLAVDILHFNDMDIRTNDFIVYCKLGVYFSCYCQAGYSIESQCVPETYVPVLRKWKAARFVLMHLLDSTFRSLTHVSCIPD